MFNCCFEHISSQVGIARLRGVFVGFGTRFFDLENDGDLDIFATNGHVMYYPKNSPFAQRPLLYENLDGRFDNVADAAGPYMSSDHVGRGVALGDLDHDGDIDLVVSHSNEPVAVLNNQTTSSHHWIRIHLIGRHANRDAIGSVVTLECGDSRQIRQVKGGTSYLSTSERTLHFGLGKTNQSISLSIRWPDGQRQVLHNVEAETTVTVVQE